MARGRRPRQQAFESDAEDNEGVHDSDEEHGYSASTAISQPNKAPRLSNAAFQTSGYDKSNIIQPLAQMKDVLLTLLQKIKANKEEVSTAVMQTWKERILALSKKIITIEFQFQCMESASNTYLAEYQEKESEQTTQVLGNSSSSAEPPQMTSMPKLPNIPEMMKEINQKIDEELNKIKITDVDFFQKVNQISKKIAGSAPGENEEEDDLEFEIVETNEEITEDSLKCPVTRAPMTNPMKNCNPNKTFGCIHTISKEGLDSLMRSKPTIACPVAGCNGKWTKGHVAVDDSFVRKLKKFERQQTLRSQVLGQFASQPSSSKGAIALDDD